jgi:hypothetical protein
MILTGRAKHTNLIFDGNSLMNISGGNVTNGMRVSKSCYDALIVANRKLSLCNISEGSTRTAERTSTFISRLPAQSNDGDIVIFWEICNEAHDFTSDTEGTALYANVVAYCNQARARGFKVVIVTGIARDFPAYDDANITDRIFACNALIRANYTSFADAIADVALISTFDAKADTTNTTYYNADRTHLTDSGYDLVATSIKTAIETII